MHYELLATYGERKFGANGFYASPLFKDQYEETQTHLLALKRKFDLSKLEVCSPNLLETQSRSISS
jgi:vitamin B12 transporter